MIVSSYGYIEQPVSWNQTGPTGPQGATGAQGIQGPTGATGPTGCDRAAGPGRPAAARPEPKGAKGDKGDTGAKGSPGKNIDVNPSSSSTIVAAVALSNPGAATLQGETQDSFDSAATNTKLAFDATSVDYQASSPALNIGSQTQGAGAGKVQAQTIMITKVMDSLSPTLLAATSSRQVFKQGLIVIPTGGAASGRRAGRQARIFGSNSTDVYITSDHITHLGGQQADRDADAGGARREDRRTSAARTSTAA